MITTIKKFVVVFSIYLIGVGASTFVDAFYNSRGVFTIVFLSFFSGAVMQYAFKKIMALKKLLREVVMRASLAFPENAQDLQWQNEEFKGQHNLYRAIGDELDLGKIK